MIAQGLGRADSARDLFGQARTMMLAAIAANPDEPETHARLAWLDASLDRAEEATGEGQRAVELSEKKDNFWAEAGSLVSLAAVYAKLGRADDAIAVLNRLFSTPTGLWISAEDLKHDPDWDRIRSAPRFQRLCEEKPHKDGE